MATALIEALNKHEGKTPDEIVRILNHRGWIKGSDMPRDLAQKWCDENVPVAICYGYDSGGFSFSGTDYRMRSFPPDYVYEHLQHHWFMLQSEFERGVTTYPNGELI